MQAFFTTYLIAFLGGPKGRTVVVEPHRHDGVFVARGKEDALVTLNFVPGSEVYGEKRISVEVRIDSIQVKRFRCDEKRRGRIQVHEPDEAKSLDTR